jgi:flavin reductase (DIM6/NTAB) family NADH-FMN oxidoreductase RutF
MGTTISQINGDCFREVLDNYPTGVVVITGMDAAEEPLGMVVGTFTSVSLSPPFVAFLQMKNSRIFNKLRTAPNSFCVNILAADQENVCGTLAAPGDKKFSSFDWHTNKAGNPVLNGAIAWLDCDYENIIEGGDHYIVLGTVKAMELVRDALPLLFFQCGYGQFAKIAN